MVVVTTLNLRKWSVIQILENENIAIKTKGDQNKDTTLILERMMSLYHWLYSIMVFLLMKIPTRVIVGSPPKIFCVH